MVTPCDRKCAGLFGFRQRIPPRWYKLIRGEIWHIGALSCYNAMNARKHGWRVTRLRGVSYLTVYAKEEVSGNNNEGAGDNPMPQVGGMQASLWGDVAV